MCVIVNKMTVIVIVNVIRRLPITIDTKRFNVKRKLYSTSNHVLKLFSRKLQH